MLQFSEAVTSTSLIMQILASCNQKDETCNPQTPNTLSKALPSKTSTLAMTTIPRNPKPQNASNPKTL